MNEEIKNGLKNIFDLLHKKDYNDLDDSEKGKLDILNVLFEVETIHDLLDYYNLNN